MMQLIKNLSEPKNLVIVCILYTTIISIFFLIPFSSGIGSNLPIDKIVHVVFNGALVFLWLFYFYQKGIMKPVMIQLSILFLAIIYGIIIEICQALFTTTRMADVWDVAANITGCIIGLLIFKLIKFKFSS